MQQVIGKSEIENKIAKNSTCDNKNVTLLVMQDDEKMIMHDQ